VLGRFLKFTVICALVLGLLLIFLDSMAQQSGKMLMHYDIEVKGEVKSLYIEGLLPESLKNRQRVFNIRFSAPQAKSIEKNDCRYFNIEYKHLKNQRLQFTAEYDLELFEYDWEQAVRQGNNEKESEEVLKRHLLLSEEEAGYSRLQAAAETIDGNSQIDLLAQINDFVSRQLHYDNSINEDIGVDQALKLGRGDCTEYSQLFVALCKMKSIPARMIGGLITNSTSSNAAHNWVEVYLTNVGWVPLDPTAIDVSEGVAFHEVNNNYIYLSRGQLGNDLVTGNTMWEWNGKKGSEVIVNCTYTYDNSMEKRFNKLHFLYLSRDFNTVQDELNKMMDYDPDNVKYICLQAMVNYKRNLVNISAQELREAAKRSRNNIQKAIVYYNTAKFHCLKGELEKSMMYLEKAIAHGYTDLLKMRNDPDFYFIRNEPSFQAMVASR